MNYICFFVGQKSWGHKSSWEKISDFWYCTWWYLSITCWFRIFPDPFWDTSLLVSFQGQDRYMIQVSQRCIQVLWVCSYQLRFVSCSPIFFSLPTACAVNLRTYLSFHKNPINHTRGIFVHIDIVPPQDLQYLFLEFTVICSVSLVFCRVLGVALYIHTPHPDIFPGFSGPSRWKTAYKHPPVA